MSGSPHRGPGAVLGSVRDVPQKCRSTVGDGSVGSLGSPGGGSLRGLSPHAWLSQPTARGLLQGQGALGQEAQDAHVLRPLWGKVCLRSPWAGCRCCSWSQEDRVCPLQPLTNMGPRREGVASAGLCGIPDWREGGCCASECRGAGASWGRLPGCWVGYGVVNKSPLEHS